MDVGRGVKRALQPDALEAENEDLKAKLAASESANALLTGRLAMHGALFPVLKNVPVTDESESRWFLVRENPALAKHLAPATRDWTACPMAQFPAEVLVKIMDCFGLDAKHRASASSVCRAWAAACKVAQSFAVRLGSYEMPDSIKYHLDDDSSDCDATYTFTFQMLRNSTAVLTAAKLGLALNINLATGREETVLLSYYVYDLDVDDLVDIAFNADCTKGLVLQEDFAMTGLNTCISTCDDDCPPGNHICCPNIICAAVGVGISSHLIAVLHQHSLRLWSSDVDGGDKETDARKLQLVESHDAELTKDTCDCVFSPSGDRLAVAAGDSPSVRIYSVIAASLDSGDETVEIGAKSSLKLVLVIRVEAGFSAHTIYWSSDSTAVALFGFLVAGVAPGNDVVPIAAEITVTCAARRYWQPDQLAVFRADRRFWFPITRHPGRVQSGR